MAERIDGHEFFDGAPPVLTTEEVRRDYCVLHFDGESWDDDAERRADFDRWLNKIQHDAWEAGAAAGHLRETLAPGEEYPQNPHPAEPFSLAFDFKALGIERIDPA